MFRRTPPRPLRPTEGNTVGLTTRFSGRYPMSVASRTPPASNECNKVTHRVQGWLSNKGTEGPAEGGSTEGWGVGGGWMSETAYKQPAL